MDLPLVAVGAADAVESEELAPGSELAQTGDGWANEPSPGSHWQLILHFTTLARAKAEVAATGLVLERVITLDGVDVTNADSTDALYFYLVARRPATA